MAYSKCSYSFCRKGDRQAGVGVTTCVDHRELAEKKLPSFQYLVFSKLLLVKADAAPKSTGLVFQCFNFFLVCLLPSWLLRLALPPCFPHYTCVQCVCESLACSVQCVWLTVQTLTYMQELFPDEHKMLTILLFLSCIWKSFEQISKRHNVEAISCLIFLLYFHIFHTRFVRYINMYSVLNCLPR